MGCYVFGEKWWERDKGKERVVGVSEKLERERVYAAPPLGTK
jgi:hypothetical protein